MLTAFPGSWDLPAGLTFVSVTLSTSLMFPEHRDLIVLCGHRPDANSFHDVRLSQKPNSEWDTGSGGQGSSSQRAQEALPALDRCRKRLAGASVAAWAPGLHGSPLGVLFVRGVGAHGGRHWVQCAYSGASGSSPVSSPGPCAQVTLCTRGLCRGGEVKDLIKMGDGPRGPGGLTPP